MKNLSMIVLVIVVLINSATVSHQLSDCLTCTDGNAVPYHITQPPTNDHVQIVSPDSEMVTLMCSLNVSIPAGMTIMCSHNNTIILTKSNPVDRGTNTVSIIRGGPISSYAGHYQCIFKDNVGHILARNFTLLILYAPRIIQPSADFHPVTFNESTSSIRLMCSLNITIPSSVTVTWTHNGAIVMSRRPKRITQAGNTTTLRIRNLQPLDAGEYQCIFNGLDLQRIILLEFQSSNTTSTPAAIATIMRTDSTNTITVTTQSSITESIDHTTSSVISTDTLINAITTTATATTVITTSMSASDNVEIMTTSTSTNSISISSPTLSISQSNDDINRFSVGVIAVIVAIAFFVCIIITVVVIGTVVVYRKTKKSKQCITQDANSKSTDHDETTVQRSLTNTPQSIDGLSNDGTPDDTYSIPTDSIVNDTHDIPNDAIPKEENSEYLKYANISKAIKLTKHESKAQENPYSIPFCHIEVQPNPAYAHSSGTIRLSEVQYY